MAFDGTILQPGTLRHQITIQAPSSMRDAAGQLNASWTTALTTRASIQSTASSTFKFSFQNNVLASNATDLITIRYPAVKIVPGMQVLCGDNTYTIQAVDDVLHRHRVLHMAVVGMDSGSS